MIDKVRQVPLYVLLAAAYPMVFFYGRNILESGPGEIRTALFAVGAAAALLVALLRAVLGSWHRAALITSVLLAGVFSYGHVVNLVTLRVHQAEPFVMLAMASVMVVLVLAALRTSRPARPALPLNVATAALLVLAAFPLVTPAAAGGEQAPAAAVLAGGLEAGADALTRPGSPPRDIYYLVFDRYGRADTFAEQFGFDNQPLLERLASRGFYVATQSHANHLQTAQSLLSALNMSYLHELTEEFGQESSDWQPILNGLADGNAVGGFLKEQGYQYVNVGSWWGPTASNAAEDHNLGYQAASSSLRGFLGTTMLAPALEALGPLGALDRRQAHVDAALAQLEGVARAVQLPGPKFVFAHVLLPHDPYVFDRHGGVLTEADQAGRPPDEQLVEQLRFTNRLLERMVDSIMDPPGMDAPGAAEPIIVISADEGPHPHRFDADRLAFQWPDATDAELRRKFRILHALHLPGVDGAVLYPGISPVNTFRLIFNEYFGTQLPLLADRSYVHRTANRPYDYVDVTERLTPP